MHESNITIIPAKLSSFGFDMSSAVANMPRSRHVIPSGPTGAVVPVSTLSHGSSDVMFRAVWKTGQIK
jgi:hypothetical protein